MVWVSAMARMEQRFSSKPIPMTIRRMKPVCMESRKENRMVPAVQSMRICRYLPVLSPMVP